MIQLEQHNDSSSPMHALVQISSFSGFYLMILNDRASSLCIIMYKWIGKWSLQILTKLISREHLTFEEAEQSLDLILHEGGAPEQIAAFLVLLAAKGAPFVHPFLT
jgi:hypothetical protein